ncbi:MAG: MFS transporter [Victivallaceae bacterium]|nr:MFS transporter [Victivallaceae bacterium]
MEKRYKVLLASMIIQVCLGSVYAWSEFVLVLKQEYAISTTQTQLIFGVTIAVFAIIMIFAGRLQDKIGPRPVACIGGLLFGLGYLIAAFSGGDFWLLLLGIGFISGSGIGFGYVCPLATCVKWFPTHQGLITGISVAGFGAGAILMAEVVEFCFYQELQVLDIFFWIAVIYGIVLIISSMFLSVPRSSQITIDVQPLKLAWLLREKKFLSLVIGMFAGTFAGLLVIGNLKLFGLAAGLTSNIATLGIVFFAIGNALGRILWGKYYDKMGSASIFHSLLFMAVSVAGLLFIDGSSLLFIIVSTFIGLGFGACFVLYATAVAQVYGANLLGSIYPWIFLAYGVSGIVGPLTGGLLFDLTGSYSPAIFIAICLTLFGVFLSKYYFKN